MSPTPLFVLLLALPPGSSARESAHHFGRARAAYRAGRYAQALDHLLEVYERSPTPEVRLGVARTAALAGAEALAHAFYRDLLDQGHYVEEARAALARLRPQLALIALSTDPPGADVYVDDAALGSYGTTPIELAVPPGTRSLLVRAAGYHPVRRELEAIRGSVARAQIRLEPKRGQLVIDAQPTDCTVRVRGPTTATLAAGRPASLPVGAYTVDVEAPGYLPESVEVVIRADARDRRRVSLRPTRDAGARVLISTGARRVPVRVDGRPRGTTPVVLALSAGPHTVEVGRTWSTTLELSAGDTRVLTPSLDALE